jgi:hypothetical protein
MAARNGGRVDNRQDSTREDRPMLSLSQQIELLHASTDRPNVIDVPERRLLALDGIGDPIGPGFHEACEALVASADAVAAVRRRRTGGPVPLGHLEAIWWKEETIWWLEAIESPHPWHWQLLIDCPSGVADDEAVTALERAARDNGALPDIERVRLIRFAEGRCVQILHLGRFDAKVNLLPWLFGEIAAMGLRVSGRHHEIYVTDPRRTAPGDWRTIVRYPVEPVTPGSS